MDERTCQAIIEKYGDLVFRLAYHQTKNRSEAEDVYQDVFMRLVRNYHKIKDDEHLQAWLIRTTINCTKSIFLDRFRKNTCEYEEIGVYDPEKSEVYYAVMELPQKQRTLVFLYYYQGYSVREIASYLEMNENTVKTLLHRARESLRDKLKGDMQDV